MTTSYDEILKALEEAPNISEVPVMVIKHKETKEQYIFLVEIEEGLQVISPRGELQLVSPDCIGEKESTVLYYCTMAQLSTYTDWCEKEGTSIKYALTLTEVA